MDKFSALLRTIKNPDKKIIPKIISLDDAYRKVKSPILLNSIKNDQNYMTKVTQIICDTTSKDSVAASCVCENITSEYYIGVFCPICNTEVTSNIVENIENEIWVEIPSHIKYVLHPKVYGVLKTWLKPKFDESYLDAILDVNKEYSEEMANNIGDHGFNYLYDNFDYIMDFFLNRFSFTKTSKTDNNLIKIFLEKYKDIMWCRKLPILSKYLQPITKEGQTLRYADVSLKFLLKSVNQFLMFPLTKIISSSSKQIEKSMWRIYSNYNKYYDNIIEKKLNPKKGYFRKNVFGTRMHFTSRAVAIPIISPVIGDEVFLSWKAALNVYKFHIINILVNRFKIKVYEAYDKIMKAFYSYDPYIDQIFQLLILECRFKGLPIFVNRNPSLLISNTILQFVTKVKPKYTIISKRFINKFGRKIDIDKISPNIDYVDNIYKNRSSIAENSIYDNKKMIDYYCSSDYSFEGLVEKFNISLDIEDVNKLLADHTVSISYLINGLMNLDFDGDSLNLLHLHEVEFVDRIIERQHPSAFFFNNNSMSISPRIGLPNQHMILLNNWLHANT